MFACELELALSIKLGCLLVYQTQCKFKLTTRVECKGGPSEQH
jgi:hypothetical protein